MTRFNTALFLATVASSALLSASAHAQSIPAPASNDGDAALHGTGATSIQNVLVQEFNCIAKSNPLGVVAGTMTSVPEPTNLPTGTSTFNCSTSELQPNFNAKYVGSGSGFGRQAWRNTTNQFTGTNVNPWTQTLPLNPNPQAPWTSVQFAFADSTATASDLTTYSTNVAPTGGAAVMFPKYVLPVAIAYNPVYGRVGSTDLRFNIRTPKAILGTTAGGLQMNLGTYCRVFNGLITNFNDPAFTADNTIAGSATSGLPLMDANDDATRWAADGVPVRLVGRLDRSGTTDIFTRHLANACTTVLGAANKFANNAETLPYSRGAANTPDFQAVRSDTGLRAASTDAVAGTTNSVGNEYFNGTAITSANVTGGGTSSMPVGAQGSGLFLVADGSGRVAAAINFAPDYPSPSNTAYRLNGKIGYIGADFLTGSPTGTALHGAALKRTTGAGVPANYVMPTAAAATTAVSSTTPPDSNIDGSYNPAAAGDRANPLNWYSVLYPALAAPTAGYPISGTTQFLGYTCYKPGNAENIANFLGWNMETVSTDSTGADRTGVFTAVANSFANSGLLTRSNIGVMPDNWQLAISETFLSDPHGLNLQIVEGNTGTQCAGRSGM